MSGSKASKSFEVYLVSRNDFEWLAEILSSVAMDTEKILRVENYLLKTYSIIMDKKDFENFKVHTLLLLEREFKKIHSLKQAYYYRNRSVKAIINFLESEDGIDLLRRKITSAIEATKWLSSVKTRFANFESGPKFTRNSYLSEWEVFLHDSWPELDSAKIIDSDKSFSFRVQSAITGTESVLDVSPQLSRAYQQLSSYYEKDSDLKLKSKRIDLALSSGGVEFKAVKGEGLYAYYKPVNENINMLKNLEAKVLAASFDEDGLPDIGTQIVLKPGLLLVIKCLGKLNATTIKSFEQFVSKVLR
jgi:hypothetical protein